jgi:hypothetical protein
MQLFGSDIIRSGWEFAIRDRLLNYTLRSGSTELYDFLQRFLEPYEPAIYGGFCRSVLGGEPVGDLDIVLLKPIDYSSFAHLFTFNKLGGCRFKCFPIEVDVWNLGDTYYIKDMKLEPNIENLFAHSNRDENRLLYLLHERRLIDGRANKTDSK